jgi:hypothetical protein
MKSASTPLFPDYPAQLSHKLSGLAGHNDRADPNHSKKRPLAPFSLHCNTCGDYIYEGKKSIRVKKTVRKLTSTSSKDLEMRKVDSKRDMEIVEELDLVRGECTDR